MPEPDDPLAGPTAPADRPPLDRPDPPRSLRERLESLADATGVTPARLVLGAAAVVAALLGALWALRPPPAPAELSLPYVPTTEVPGGGDPAGGPDDGRAGGGGAGSPAGGGPAPGATDPVGDPTELVVHVAGAVAEPGVHRLDAGARVVDAVLAAGGLAAEADEARINLAAPLGDGQRVYVPAVGEEDVPIAVDPGPGEQDAPADGDGGPLVDLNRAGAAELEALPGIGPATAQAILEHRARAGAFSSVDQLVEVRGIGPAKLDAVRDLVRV